MRSSGRVVEGARLESVYTVTPYRGFESLLLRHPLPAIVALLKDRVESGGIDGFRSSIGNERIIPIVPYS